MTDHDVRDFLERMVAEEPAPFFDAEPLARRARRRAARTVVLGTAGIVAAIAVLFAGASRLPDVSPNVPANDPTPTVRPFPEGSSTFASALHGITIDHPAGWEVRPATEPWRLGTVTFDAPNVDVIFHPEHLGQVYLALASEPLGRLSPDDWVGGPTLSSTGICADAAGGSGGSFALDGATGSIGSCGGPSASSHSVMVATDTRGYLIVLHVADRPALQAAYDGDFFESLLETVHLEDPENGGGA